jgi:NifU-like protein involved in Fe-S cluster formation
MLRVFGNRVVCRSGALWARPAAPVITRGYHEDLIDHYENPRNVGRLDKKAADVGTGLVGAPACGDVMQLQIQVDDAGVVVESKFKTFGCGSAIASSSLATEATSITNKQIATELKLPPVKLHCRCVAQHLCSVRRG